MANKAISMTEIILIQQLKEQGHSIRSISRKTGLHRKTIQHYLFALAAAHEPQQAQKSAEPLPEESTSEGSRLSILQGYFPYFDKELSRLGVTRFLLWEDYRRLHSTGYGYTQFCEHYSRYRS